MSVLSEVEPLQWLWDPVRRYSWLISELSFRERLLILIVGCVDRRKYVESGSVSRTWNACSDNSKRMAESRSYGCIAVWWVWGGTLLTSVFFDNDGNCASTVRSPHPGLSTTIPCLCFSTDAPSEAVYIFSVQGDWCESAAVCFHWFTSIIRRYGQKSWWRLLEPAVVSFPPSLANLRKRSFWKRLSLTWRGCATRRTTGMMYLLCTFLCYCFWL